MILQLDDAYNIISLLEICGHDPTFRKLVERELELLGLKRRLTKKTRELIIKGVWASVGLSLNYEIEEEHTFEDMAIDTSQNTEELVMEKFAADRLTTSLERISPLLRGILSHRFGLLGYESKSYKEIGSIYLLHQVDIKDMEKKALTLLKMYMSDEPIVEDYTGAVALLLAIAWRRGEDDK